MISTKTGREKHDQGEEVPVAPWRPPGSPSHRPNVRYRPKSAIKTATADQEHAQHGPELPVKPLEEGVLDPAAKRKPLGPPTTAASRTPDGGEHE
jgi:hypothetical protein